MTDDMFRVVLESAGAKTDKEGWSALPEGRTMTLHAAHDGVGLTIGKVEAAKVSQRTLWARSTKGEMFIVSMDDVFGATIDRGSDGSGSSGRKAGFLG